MTTDLRTGSSPAGSTNGRRQTASDRSALGSPTATERSNDVRRYAAEFIGTALLVIVGVGVAVLAPGAGPLGIALAFGLILTVLVYAIGPVSGCHLNPAVTLGMLLCGRLPAGRAVLYVAAQIVGGIVGAAVVLAVASNRTGYSLSRDGLGANGWGSHSAGGYGVVAAAIVEVLLTAVLVLTVLRVTSDSDTAQIAGVPIGLALLTAHLVAVPIDGTSVNPARSIGPALLHGGTALGQLWLFIIAPLAGAVLAVAALKFLTLRSENAAIFGDHRSAAPGPVTTRIPAPTAPRTTGAVESSPTGNTNQDPLFNSTPRRTRKRKGRRNGR